MRPRCELRAPLVGWGLVGALAFIAPAIAQPSFFTGVGDLPGGRIESLVRGISADGRVVVGRSSSARGEFGEAFRWMDEEGIVGLGDLPGGSWFSDAAAVSANGRVIVGTGFATEVASAVRWVDGRIEMLGDLGGQTPFSRALGVSADGQVIVGSAISLLGTEAFRWTPSTGMVGLGDLPGGAYYSVARAVSPDGAIIVGESRSANGAFMNEPQAMRWTAQTGMVGLGDLPGYIFRSYAYAVSADGSLVVGQGNDGFGSPAAYWTPLCGGSTHARRRLGRGWRGPGRHS